MTSVQQPVAMEPQPPLPHGHGPGSIPAATSDAFARNLLESLVRFRDGDFSSRMPNDLVGLE
ncbi:MAG TPA: hypothetical protein VJR89_09100, partial [Polyangiales bacterium]|nr:hypothetical protein [Polyangiales bacterium]